MNHSNNLGINNININNNINNNKNISSSLTTIMK